MAAGGNESGHMELASQDCVGIGSFLLVLFNPIVWIALLLSKITLTEWNLLWLVVYGVLGWWSGWAIKWTILYGIPWVFKTIYNYLKYRVQLYQWKKRNPYRLPSQGV